MAVALTCVLVACSTARVDERLAYWKAETALHLPSGTARSEAQAFFSARGAALQCCVSEVGHQQFHYARERNVGRQLWMEYDVVVLVEFSADEAVSSVRVQRWGVGL